jgi:hypothetical protein
MEGTQTRAVPAKPMRVPINTSSLRRRVCWLALGLAWKEGGKEKKRREEKRKEEEKREEEKKRKGEERGENRTA